MEINLRHFSNLVLILTEIMNLFVKVSETLKAETVFIWLEKIRLLTGEKGLGACSGLELTLMLPSDYGHGDSRILNVIFMLFMVI